MERGTIDACEWVGPYDDEKLGFNKVAKYYYTPGVMELEATNVIMVGKQPWASLPPRYQAALRYAGNYAATEMLASYDAKNAQAIARLVASGTQLSVLPEDVIKALRGALETVLDEEAASNEQFKKILANWRAVPRRAAPLVLDRRHARRARGLPHRSAALGWRQPGQDPVVPSPDPLGGTTMARYDDRDWDDDRRDRRHVHGRYSGAQAGDDRHRQERWRHGGYGSDWQPGRDTDRDYGMDRGDYYDPDHEYRRRRYQRASDREEPYAERPMPGEHADRRRDRRITAPGGRRGTCLGKAERLVGGEGRHRGVGPKGYVRSDERIRELGLRPRPAVIPSASRDLQSSITPARCRRSSSCRDRAGSRPAGSAASPRACTA